MEYVIVDTETTGLSPTKCRIIEIAAVRVVDNQIQDNFFQSLVNPGFEVSPFITNLTGISNDELSRAEGIRSILPKFLDFLGNQSVFVAHNARFDWAFINEELKRSQLQQLNCHSIDTIHIAKHVVPGLRSYSLKYLIEYFEFNHIKNHRALDDARITAQLFLHLLNPINAGPSTTQ